MDELREELMLYRFDKIQIYRGGLDILCLTLQGNTSGRSVYLEINDYRRRIIAVLSPTKRDWVPIVISIAGVLVTLGFQYWLWEKKNNNQ